jgi:hypothetical protein
LLLNATCIHAVKVEVVIIARASREANRALIASTVILSERRKQSKAGRNCLAP